LSDSLEFTGERFTPECVREIWYEHFHRYALAARWCSGSHTLDAACGEGYGSALLAQTGAAVKAVDISSQAISHARKRYGHLENIEFQVADCTELPFDDEAFDRIVSFETLEHLLEQDKLLAEFRRVLKPGGFLVLSSPDKATYSDAQGAVNEFHVKELYREELEELIGRHFPACHLLAQKLMFHSAIWSMEQTSQVVFDQVNEGKTCLPSAPTQAPMYYIALCAADSACLPDLSEKLWLFDDHEETVYSHYHGEIRRNMAAGGIIANLQKEIEDLRSQAKQRESQQGPWWRRFLPKP
jgi:SAM-dependent methyltransferase